LIGAMSAPCLPVSHHKKKRKRNHSNSSDGEVLTNGDEEASHDQGRNDESDEEEAFDDIQTMDASEYLSRVVNQAKKLPEVFVSQTSANNDESDKHTIPKRHRNHVPIDGSAASLQYLVSGRASLTRPPSEGYLPKSKNEWVKATLENFEKLRDYLEECRYEGIGGKLTDRMAFPPMKDQSGWHMFCMGPDEADGNVNSYFGEEYGGVDSGTGHQDEKEEAEIVPAWQLDIPADGHAPSVRLLSQMDQVLVRRVLSHLSHYTSQGWKLTPQRTAWIYALLVRLEKPVHRDDASTLFGLLKVLTRSRSAVDVKVKNRSELAFLNVLIVLIGIYFEQGANIVMSVI
jgi:survival of motor neuron protein-interacting protein 1